MKGAYAHLDFFLFFSIFSPLSSRLFSEATTSINKDFVVLTIPKAGTHLLVKTLKLMLDLNAEPLFLPASSVEELENSLKDTYYYIQHFPLNPIHEQYAIKKKSICIVRDPRDILISLVHHVTKIGWPGMTKDSDYHIWFNTLSFDDKISYILLQDIKDSPLSF